MNSMSSLNSRVYVEGELVLTDAPMAEVSNYINQPNSVIIIDLLKPAPSELETLANLFDLHDVAVDALENTHQRPRLSRYDTHFAITLRAIHFNTSTSHVSQSPISVFFGSNWVIVVHRNEYFPLKQVYQDWDSFEVSSRQQVAFFLYALLSNLLDSYDDMAEVFNDYLDDLSEQVFSEHPISPGNQRQWFLMRRALMNFHRLINPTRESLSAMTYRPATTTPDEVRPYYQDLYDRTLTLTESSEALRDMATSIAEANLSLRDYRQNQIMKQVTSWAAILAVPTLVTGFYGMNVPFPGYGNTAGLATSVGLIVVLSIILYVVFRRKEWI